jgi:3-methyladenine DNA glycosylase AlkD
MGKPAQSRHDPVADLKRRLRARDPSIKAVRACVRGWWTDHDFNNYPGAVTKGVALTLIAQRQPEHKLAGITVLHELLGDQLRVTDVAAFAQLFEDGHLSDHVVVDYFTSKVLVALLARAAGRADVAKQLATWRNADTIWQRRAGCLAFVALAPACDAAILGVALEICATVLWSHERFDQTAVATLLCELSVAHPARVESFVRKHARLMSKACARKATSKLPVSTQAALRAHHKRATSITRR